MEKIDFLKEHRFIVILRYIDKNYIKDVAKALYDGGVRIFEVTFNPSDAHTCQSTAEMIKEIKAIYGDEIMVGAGTVVCMDYAKAAFQAGAEFIVSPCTNKEIIEYTKQNGMLSIPGAYTPTEISNAHDWGADIVKIFPVLPDETDYVKTVFAPLSHIPFIPTGGISPDTIEAFLDTGAVAVGAGASVLNGDMVKNGQYDLITKNALVHTEKAKKFKRS